MESLERVFLFTCFGCGQQQVIPAAITSKRWAEEEVKKHCWQKRNREWFCGECISDGDFDAAMMEAGNGN